MSPRRRQPVSAEEEEEGSLAQLVAELSRLAVAPLASLVPPRARRHLSRAQREVLLALAAIAEHNADRRGGRAGARGRGRRPPSRVDLD